MKLHAMEGITFHTWNQCLVSIYTILQCVLVPEQEICSVLFLYHRMCLCRKQVLCYPNLSTYLVFLKLILNLWKFIIRSRNGQVPEIFLELESFQISLYKLHPIYVVCCVPRTSPHSCVQISDFCHQIVTCRWFLFGLFHVYLFICLWEGESLYNFSP